MFERREPWEEDAAIRPRSGSERVRMVLESRQTSPALVASGMGIQFMGMVLTPKLTTQCIAVLAVLLDASSIIPPGYWLAAWRGSLGKYGKARQRHMV
jgi:hypothetical protein